MLHCEKNIYSTISNSLGADITRSTCCGTLVYRPGRNKIPRPRFEHRGFIFPEERISRCEMGLWDEGNPGLLSGRKKNKSRGGVPALGFNPHHLRRTEERKSVLEGPAWTPRWSQNHLKINWFSGPKLEQRQMSCQKALCILRKEEASHFIFWEQKRLLISVSYRKRNRL